MKTPLLLLLLCSAFPRLYARADLPTKIYSRQDTAQAVQYLFADKRSSGKIWTMVGGCNMVGGLFALPLAIVGVVPTGFGLIKQTRFRRHREQMILNDYKAGMALPKRIESRLKTRYFG